MRTNVKFTHFLFLIPIIPLLVLKDYSYHWDGIDYAWQLEHVPFPYLFHQHHLIFTPFMKILFLGISSFGLKIRSLDFMIFVNIVVGIFYLVICYFLLKRIFKDKQYIALIGISFITLSYTFGTYWRNVDAYMIPLAIITFILYRVVRFDSQPLKVDLFDWFLLLLATIFHQTSILILPALIFAQYNSFSQKRIARLTAVVTGFFISLAGLYLLVYYSMSPHITHKSFFKWIRGYAAEDYWIFSKYHGTGRILYQSLRESVISHRVLFLAPVKSQLIFSDEKVLYGHFSFFIFLGWFIFFLIACAIIYGAVRLLLNPKSRMHAIFLITWILPFLVLFQVYSTDNSFYRMLYLLPLVIFFMTALTHFMKTRIDRTSSAIFLMGFILFNLIFGFIPESNAISNPTLTYAKEVEESTSPRDLFIFSPSPDYHPKVYLEYFTDRDVFTIRHLPSSERSTLSDEQLKALCNQSRKWLMDNYNNFYFSRGVTNYSMDYMQISTLDQNKKLPELLILDMSQIKFIDVIEIGTYPFNHAEILEYK